MINQAGPVFTCVFLIASLWISPRAGIPALWDGSRLTFADDYLGKLWQSYALSATGTGIGIWPKTRGEICGSVDSTALTPADSPLLRLLLAECRESGKPRPVAILVNAGAYPLDRLPGWQRPFETFGSGWGSVLVRPESGTAWASLPPALQADLGYAVSPHGFLHARIGLKRDLSAWTRDDLGLNTPLSEKEIDLNEPSLGYFHAENDRFGFTIGRFQVHWSSSPDFGLALSRSTPFHNAAEFSLKMPRARYRFLVSSLNPWLEGTPPGDSSGEAYPPGSEEYRQRHYPDSHGAGNAHHRVYAERIKTLFAHRLEGRWGPVAAGLTETQIIGGKVPDLRDAGPFVLFHNDFKDGYTNSALSLDASIGLPLGFSVAAEAYLDDVEYGDTESEGGTATLMGFMGALRHGLTAAGWSFSQSLHAIRTDPYLYGYGVPLNTMTSRHVLASNNQEGGDAVLVDRYVIDYPIGYVRGGDALDFWYRMDARRGPWGLSLAAALLAQGEVDIHTPYLGKQTSSLNAPTGTVEHEIRIRLDAGYRFARGLEAHGGLGWQDFRNEGHRKGDDPQRFRLALGASFTLRP